MTLQLNPPTSVAARLNSQCQKQEKQVLRGSAGAVQGGLWKSVKMVDSPTCYSRLSRERIGKWWSTDTGMEWGTSFSDTAICMMCLMTFDYCTFTCMLYQMWLCTLLEHIHKASRNFTQSLIIWNGARKSWTRVEPGRPSLGDVGSLPSLLR